MQNNMAFSNFVIIAVIVSGICIPLSIESRRTANKIMKGKNSSYTGIPINTFDFVRIFKTLLNSGEITKKDINTLWFYFVISAIPAILIIVLLIIWILHPDLLYRN